VSIARGEQETIIRRDCEGLHAWSNVPSDINRFKEQGWRIVKEDRYGIKFDAPDHAIRIMPAKKRKRELTEKQRAALAKNSF